MKLTKTAGVLLAVLLIATAGVAALPGNAPADSQAGQGDNTTDANAGNAPADAGPGMSDSEMGNESASSEDRQGPPTDMPAQVPDHVSQIHDLIHQFLDGDVDNLGEQISELMDEEDAADEQADEDAEDADEDDSDEREQNDADEDSDDEEMDDADGDDADSKMTDDATATATPA